MPIKKAKILLIINWLPIFAKKNKKILRKIENFKEKYIIVGKICFPLGQMWKRWATFFSQKFT
jgi:hypothetical protein